YKKIDLIVEAFAKTNKKLLVIGEGPDEKKIKSMVTQNTELLGFVKKKEMIELVSKAKAFIFAAEEDFGIAPIEAQAAGVPVIAFGKGGGLETINGIFPGSTTKGSNITGVFFEKQNVESLLGAVEYFEENPHLFKKEAIRENAQKFSIERFEREFEETVTEIYKNWKNHQIE